MATEIIKKYGLLIALSLVLFLSVVDIFFVSVSEPRIEKEQVAISSSCVSTGDEKLAIIPKISEIQGPAIDRKAAQSFCEVSSVLACKDLKSSLWVFLLISYIALLIFNLGWGVAKNSHIQWGWEAIMTGIFVSMWFVFDQCAQNLWFPLYLTKLGIAIYIAYLYFFLKNKDDAKRG